MYIKKEDKGWKRCNVLHLVLRFITTLSKHCQFTVQAL